MNRLFVLAALAASLVGSVYAQSDGAIIGVVRDPSGAAAPNATVRVVQEETGAARELRTGPEGRFQAIRLAPGSYSVAVENEGFRRELIEGLELDSGRTLEISVDLQLGEQRDEVVVTAETPLISTAAADWGGLVESEKLKSLPLNGRDLFELSVLEPGATAPVSARTGLAQGLGSQISISGSRPNQNAYQIDGVWVNDATDAMPSSAAGLVLGLETVREIHLVTNPFSADYGRTAGGLFKAVSQSGTNQFHGAVYEYFRNSSLDAKNYFDPAGESIPPLRRNQYGGVLHGPVVADKLFFLVNWEGLRERRGRTQRTVVPSQQAKSGVLPGEGGGVRQVTVADTVKPYLGLYPNPNGRDFRDGTGEFVAQQTNRTNQDFFSGKLDWNAADALRFHTRYTYDDAVSVEPDPFGIWDFSLGSNRHFLTSEAEWIQPNTIASLRAGYSRVDNAETSEILQDIPAELSFVQGEPLGTLTVTGLTDFGGFLARARPRTFVLNSFQLNGDVTHMTARHTLLLGGGFDRVGFDQESDLSFVGSYTFPSLERLLAGRPSVAEVAQPGSDTERHWRYNQFQLYAQDSFRPVRGLDLSFGLRWEAASTPTERDGKVAAIRDLYNDRSVTVGDPLYTNPSWNNFAPRASLAWDPLGEGRMVVRAGAGLFYDLLGSRELVIAGVRTPPFYNRILVFGAPGFPDILNAAAGRTPSASVDGLDYEMQQPTTARWQLNVESRVGRNAVARVGYSGMRAYHLMGQLGNFNTPIPQQLSDGRWFFPADAPRLNPAFSRIGLRRSQFNAFYHGMTASLESRWRGRFRYQAKYTWSKAIDETSNATFNDFVASDQVPTTPDYRLNRGLADFDLRHVFAGSFSVVLPRLRNNPVRWALGGWELHGLTQWQSGNPFAPSVGFDQARLQTGFGDTGQRPDLAASAGADLITGRVSQWFDPTGFSLPAPGFLGTLGRGTLIGPSLFSFDVGVHKRFTVTERQAVTLRAEFFNATNHPNFQTPTSRELFNEDGSRVGSAGRITETATSSRQIQLALRYEF